MSSYRVELASTSRAGCQSTECKAQAAKIQKGELRMGVYVTIGDFQSWRWKHWGCVTPAQVANLQETFGDGDFDMFDGYEDLGQYEKDKIAKAVEQGHVADDDWRGDVEMNRPGMKGYRTPESKRAAREAKKAAAAAEQDEDPAKTNGDSSPTKPASKKRGRPKAESEPEAEDEDEPARKKTKGRQSKSKKAKAEGEDDIDDVKTEIRDAPVKKEKAAAKKGRKVKIEEGVQESEGGQARTVEPKKAKRTGKASAKVKLEDQNDDSPAPKKRKRNTRKVEEPTEQDEDGLAESELAPVKKRGRKPKAATKVEDEPQSQEDPPKRRTKTSAKPAKGEQLDSDPEVDLKDIAEHDSEEDSKQPVTGLDGVSDVKPRGRRVSRKSAAETPKPGKVAPKKGKRAR